MKTSTYLLTWNPKMWRWPQATITEEIRKLRELGPEGFAGSESRRWSIGTNYRRIRSGDRLFLARVGSEPRGIFASGHAVSDPYQAPHWSDEGRELWYVDVAWDILKNPYNEASVVLRSELKAISATQRWSPLSSGELLEGGAATRLEEVWKGHVGTSSPLPPEADRTVVEGAPSLSVSKSYERDPSARKRCIEAHGLRCSVCTFDFQEAYGEIGRGFIHVHHLTPLSSVAARHVVDPVKDLLPVCPNCHAMLHRKEPPYSVEELQQVLSDGPEQERGLDAQASRRPDRGTFRRLRGLFER